MAPAAVAACTAPARTTVPTSTGPWQFSGAVFASDNQVVGGPIAGARLAMMNGEAVRATTTTDAAGRYAFNAIETGRFTLAISAPGFTSVAPTISIDRDMRVDFALTRQ